MRLPLFSLFAIALILAACGKKQDSAPAPAGDSGTKKVSVDAVTADAPPPPPPPVSAPAAEATTPNAPAAPVEEGNWFARKTVAEKRELMEGWLHQYQAPGADKAEIIKQVKNSKLSAADWALLEELRNSFKYPPLPVR
jgi:hypothetical protein